MSKNLLKTFLFNNARCGCGRPKPSDVHHPSQPLTNPKLFDVVLKKHPNPSSSSSTSHLHEHRISTASTFLSFKASQSSDSCAENGRDHLKSTSKIIDSIAVVKDSDDPYQDFKTSMLQMILEKEMYSEDDLGELLNCFLELNSGYHHGAIIQAFTEIWNEVIVAETLLQ